VLFLDEPTKTVDALAASDLKRLIRDKLSGETGRTVLLATHRMEEAEQLCDRIAIILSGRIVFCGTIPELRLRTGVAEQCVMRMHGIDAEWCRSLAEQKRLVHPAVVRPGGNGLVELRFNLGDDRAQLSGILRDVLDSGGTVLSMDRQERGLEEMFLEVVRGGARAQ
jgi:ABC-type multidrug transport system ATPase subunit